MTGRHKPTSRRLLIVACAVAAALSVIACGESLFEIPIETPLRPKLDVGPFQRVLIAGFVAGGSEDVDAVRLVIGALESGAFADEQDLVEGQLVPFVLTRVLVDDEDVALLDGELATGGDKCGLHGCRKVGENGGKGGWQGDFRPGGD